MGREDVALSTCMWLLKGSVEVEDEDEFGLANEVQPCLSLVQPRTALSMSCLDEAESETSI